jgi:hypothetical protein
MTDIRDIKPLMDVFPWELVILGVIFFALACATIWRMTRHPHRNIPTSNKRPRSIRQRLDLLRHKNLSPEQLCENLGELMRDYLRLRYGIPCHRLTTEEILVEIQRREIPESVAGPLTALFEACDLVKFAKWKPQAVEIQPHLTSAYWILDDAKEPTP